MSAIWETRLALNESMFRSLNEKLASIPDGSGDGRTYDFICECSNTDCFERVALTGQAYENVGVEGTHFLIAYGHENSYVETIVETHDGYLVVEKEGAAGVIADDEDPRG